MILVDNSQVVLSGIFAHTRGDTSTIDENLVRHTALNSYRYIRSRFSGDYGELVICEDSKDCWRKKFFPLYKAARKKSHENDSNDWRAIYDTLTKIRNEVRETFPYKNMKVDNCEADDIIAVITRQHCDNEKIMIVSGDKDFQQLQTSSNVNQYSPIQKKMIVCEDPKRHLIEHVIGGDRSDGVPNILSDDDVFMVEDKRQKPCGKKKISTIIEDIDNWKTTRNWERNETLVDLSKIPVYIVDRILDEWEKPTEGSRSKIFNYMVSHKLNNLIGDIQDF